MPNTGMTDIIQMYVILTLVTLSQHGAGSDPYLGIIITDHMIITDMMNTIIVKDPDINIAIEVVTAIKGADPIQIRTCK